MEAKGPIKVLTVGSAVGSISQLFAKVRGINAKHGPFDLLLCTGDFFGPVTSDEDEDKVEDEVSQLLDGILEAPVDCYIMQGDQPLPKRVVDKFAKTNGELCKNVFLMSKSGTITTAHGIRIACLGGVYDQNIYYASEAAPGFLSPFFASQTIDRLLANTLAKTSTKQNYSSLSAIQSSTASSQHIDIFLSNAWPSAITRLSSVPLPDPNLASIGAPPLDELISKLQPRYHFAAAGGSPPKFWEREPFVWDGEEGRVTRFVSLGAFGNDGGAGKKQRWFYAFTIAPTSVASAPVPRPANASQNPFTTGVVRSATKRPLDESGENFIFGSGVKQPTKRSRTVQGEPGKPPPGYKCRRCDSTEHFINDCPERSKPPDNYICKICNTPGHFVRDCPTRDAVGDTGGKKPKPGYVCRACGSEEHYLEDCLTANQQRGAQSDRRGGRRGPPKEISTDECWFCLSNPNLAKHLIVAIGNECYVTLPKGQIIPTHSDNYTPQVPGGGHVLIVPITHCPTYSTIPRDLAKPILDETESFKTALSSLYNKFDAVPVFFEVARLSAKGGHAHVQAVPVPLRLKDKIEEHFVQEGRRQGIDFESDPESALESCQGGRGSYFRVDLPNGKKMVHLLKDNVPFSIQFGRQVLVSLLEMPDRFDWKACMLSEEDDRADVQAFKAAFAPFDPAA
ncbi:nuclear protein [Coprinopsis cinerea okayama7|uniref:Nuclear protein n=1 Tax=Coprinopsis cinerea (strain Okayama-7 / 130 / ATCC MYA-4618 / FGSC 9003) TaxID=240176 RepID=A8NEI6_COPC7|nr:nuclear protein [Coprinopsis cinerea okayama7\|eukprot:XP_001833038.2 nuclear protein [Coprinopsis cinerea okayama7\